MAMIISWKYKNVWTVLIQNAQLFCIYHWSELQYKSIRSKGFHWQTTIGDHTSKESSEMKWNRNDKPVVMFIFMPLSDGHMTYSYKDRQLIKTWCKPDGKALPANINFNIKIMALYCFACWILCLSKSDDEPTKSTETISNNVLLLCSPFAGSTLLLISCNKNAFFIHFGRKSRCVHVVEFLCNKERIIDWQSVYKNKQTVFENTQMKCAWLCDAWDNKIHRLLVFDHKSQYGIFRLFTMYIIVA